MAIVLLNQIPFEGLDDSASGCTGLPETAGDGCSAGVIGAANWILGHTVFSSAHSEADTALP